MALDSTPKPMLLDFDPGHFGFYVWQNIMIVRWSRSGTGPAVERLTHVREKLETEHPEGLSVVHLIVDNAGLPTAEARAGVKELLARYRNQRVCLAVVVLGAGFWASAMRAAITGVRMLIPGELAMSIFAELEDVAKWLPPRHQRGTGTSIAPDQLLGVLRSVMAGP
jgi:hypothetical protein